MRKSFTLSIVLLVMSLLTVQAQMAGTYTIDRNQPASGTNFTSFQAAADSLTQLGVNGSVVLEVASGSGPYTEQVVFSYIPGASASQTITLDGNSETIRFAPTSNADRHILLLDSVRHLTIRSLNVSVLSSATRGVAIELENRSDSVSVTGCTLEIASSNSNMFRMYGLSALECSSLTVDSNVFNYGRNNILIQGSPNRDVENIQVSNNTLDNASYVGIQLSRVGTTVVRGNVVSRSSNDLGNTSYRAIECGQGSQQGGKVIIADNRISNVTKDRFLDIDFDGIYLQPGFNREVEVINNEIYNINNSGRQVGITDAQSDVLIFNNTIALTNGGFTGKETIGIVSNFSSNSTIYNNVIALNRSGSGEKKALDLGNLSDHIIDYNVYHLQGQGSGEIAIASFDQQGVGNVTVQSFSDWQAVMVLGSNAPYDEHGYWADPLFNLSSSGAEVRSPLLDGTAKPLLEVTQDITGATRSVSHPDIGAREFTAPSLDAGVTDLQKVLGQCDFGVQVTNFGRDTLVEYTLHVQLNGNTPQTWLRQDTLWPGRSALVQSFGLTLLPDSIYDIKAWTSAPNGGLDAESDNDTAQIASFQLPVQGSYSVGGSGADFTSLNAAIAYITSSGICGPVVIDMDSAAGPYTEQVRIPYIEGVDSTRTLTIKGHGAVLRFAPNNNILRYLIRLDNAYYVTIDSLNMQVLSNASYGWPIHLKGAAGYNTIQHCTFFNKINGNERNDFANVVISNSNERVETSGFAHHNLIQKNTMIGGDFYNISFRGSSNSPIVGNQIIDNTLVNHYLVGVYVDGTSQTLVSGNDISRPNRSDFNNSGVYGLIVEGSATSLVIERNRIHTPYRPNLSSSNRNIIGIAVSSVGGSTSTTGTIIKNNLIYDHPGKVGRVRGISISQGNYVSCLNNTIVLDKTNSTLCYGFQSSLFTGRTVTFKNNLVYITGSSSSDAYGYLISNSIAFDSDYNNVYFNTTGSGTDIFAQQQGQDYMTLADWQANTPRDPNSVAVDPAFIGFGADPYQPQSGALNDRGAILSEVTTDIKGLPRPATTPDIGAYEFDVPDIAVSRILSGSTFCEGATTNVSVRVKNVSVSPTSNFQITYRLDNNPPISETIGTIVLPLDSIDHTFAVPLQLSATGTRTLQVYISADANPTNDSLSQSIEVFPAPVIPLVADTSICSGSSITLSAGNFESYQWSTTDTVSTIQVSDTGRYSVEVTDINGCSSRDSMQLSLWPDHLITTPGLTSFCPGGQAVLDAGKDAAHYLWSEGDTTQSITVSDSGMYWVETTTTQGCIRRDTLSVAIYPEPVVDITITPISPTSRWLDAGVFNNYQWNTNENTRRITVTQNGSYWVEVTDGNGCTGRDTIEILTLDVGDEPLQQRFSIHPNPVQNELSIVFNTQGEFSGSAEIYTLQGNLLKSFNVSNNKQVFSVEDLAKGIYLLKLSNTSKQAYYRFIKQ